MAKPPSEGNAEVESPLSHPGERGWALLSTGGMVPPPPSECNMAREGFWQVNEMKSSER